MAKENELLEKTASANSCVAVLGAGSFGSVLANIMAKNACKVSLWVRSDEHYKALSESYRNDRYLEDFEFDASISFSNNLDEALKDAQFVFLAIPSRAFRLVLPQIKNSLKPGAVIISTAKGIEPDTFKMMTQVIEDEIPNVPVAALSGPNIAAEIARGELAGSVIASKNQNINEQIQGLLSSRFFRVYDNPDIYGVELAGALKNIYAIASGMSHALGMGENARAMLLTRSLAEMSRFAVATGANPMTFLGLAGVGDLYVTCTSQLSRNFRLGTLIAQGKSAQEAMKEIGSTVEGYSTVKTVCDEAKRMDIYMPLVSALHDVLYRNEDILLAVKALMLGSNSHDVEFMQGH